MNSLQDRIAAAIILVATFVIFRVSPVHTIYDSRYEMLFTQQLLRHHSFSLGPETFSELRSHKPGQQHRRGIDFPYQLVQVGDSFYNFYPPGNTILGLPYVALANAVGLSATDQTGTYNPNGDDKMQKGLAALLMAGLSVIIFFTARLVLSLGWSWLITIASAFGTQIWSTASRAVWSQTWGIFVLGLAIWLIFRTEIKKVPLRPIFLATCLSWLYFIRPTFSISIAAIGLYVLVYHRKILAPFILTGCIWLAAFIGFSEYHFGQLLPPYYHSYDTRSLDKFWERFAGTVISPSRGLLVYVSAIWFLIYLLARYWKTSRVHLVILSTAVVVVHVIMVACYLGWHGGASYGPRLTTDIVPWLVLLGILAVDARLRWHDKNKAHDSPIRLRTEWSFAVVLLACSITLNGIGAIWQDTQRWNAKPENVNEAPSRLWDWKHPQFLGVPRNGAKVPP